MKIVRDYVVRSSFIFTFTFSGLNGYAGEFNGEVKDNIRRDWYRDTKPKYVKFFKKHGWDFLYHEWDDICEELIQPAEPYKSLEDYYNDPIPKSKVLNKIKEKKIRS